MSTTQLNLIRLLVVACNEMADKWSESNDARKQELWQHMTTALRNYCEAYGWPAQWVNYEAMNV